MTITWTPTGHPDDPTGRLHGSGLEIEGVAMHAEAIAVADDDRWIQRAVDRDSWDEDLDYLRAATGGDGRYQTTTIDGFGDRRYVVFASPHCD